MADSDSDAARGLATLDEAAAFLGVSTTRIIQLLNRNELQPPGAKPPGVYGVLDVVVLRQRASLPPPTSPRMTTLIDSMTPFS
jgi:hypothetical protein